MLLAVAAEFRKVDHSGALNELDSLALPLFGAAGLPVRDRLRLMAAELGGPDGLRPGPSVPLDGLWLDRVLEARRGHPALIAAVYIEVARRAGFELALLSASEGEEGDGKRGGGAGAGRRAAAAAAALRARARVCRAVRAGDRFRSDAGDARRAAGLRCCCPWMTSCGAKIRAELA